MSYLPTSDINFLKTIGDRVRERKVRDPTELLYHLAQPAREVATNKVPIYTNAVYQVLVFILLTLQACQHDNNERNTATKACYKWEIDVDYILDKITQIKEEAAQTAKPTAPTQKKCRQVPTNPN